MTGRWFEVYCQLCEIFYNPHNMQADKEVIRDHKRFFRLIVCPSGHIMGRKEVLNFGN